jgi:AcrR family transcriptional regulator
MAERRRGAVRSESARVAILEATSRLVATRGYDHLTVEGIAAEAGVGKQTIYRWWPSKGAVVAEALFEGLLLSDQFIPADTGDLRTDLTAWLGHLYDFVGDAANQTMLHSLLEVAAEHEAVGSRLQESLGGSSQLTARLHAAIEQGQLPEDAPVEEILEALVGALILKLLSRKPIESDAAARFVDFAIGR